MSEESRYGYITLPIQALADVLANARTHPPLNLTAPEAVQYEFAQDDMYAGLVKAIGDVCMASNGHFDRGRFEYAAGVRMTWED